MIVMNRNGATQAGQQPEVHAPEGRTPDQHDAYTVATCLREADHDGHLLAALKPNLMPQQA